MHATTKDRDVVVRMRDMGPLHDLLLKACPADDKGVKSISVLAGRLHITTWSIYKWIIKGKIPPTRAVEVVDLAEGRVTLADFAPFIYV